jgi:hypothetical protein
MENKSKKNGKEKNLQHYQVLISAETRSQGMRILEALMSKRLAFGGPVFNGPSQFLWNFQGSAVPKGMQKNDILMDEHDYCFVVTYSREDLKKELIEVAEETSVEEVCMISFIEMEGNAALIKLLDDIFDSRNTSSSPPKHTDAVAALTFVPSNEIATRTRKSSTLSQQK